jgi:hypothetical protein
MVDGVRLGKDELKARYGVSERMAVRIGALLSKGLEVSAAVLEESLRNKGVEALLLGPDLLAKAAAIDETALKPLSLAIVSQDGRKILALEEETMAEQAWLPAPLKPAALTPTGAIDAPEARGLFSSDEIGRLKLTLLTGVDPKAKMEALRKLAFAPLTTEEKGVLALRLLADPDAEVRREAAASLERLGLDRELSDALRDAAAGSPKQRELAFRKIAAMAGRLPPVERSVTVSALVAAMEFERDAAVLKELFGALGAYPAGLGPDALTKVAGQLVKIVAEHPAAMAAPTRNLIETIATPAAAAAIWREADAVNERKLKLFFFEAIARMPMDAELEQTLCRRAAEELAAGVAEDLDSRRLSDALLDRGDAALDALLKVLPQAKEGSRAHLVGVVDAIAASAKASDRARGEAGQAMLGQLRQGSRLIRTAVMEARLPWHPGLPDAMKGQFAADFITNLHAYRVSRMHDLTAAVIRKIGFAADAVLRETIRKSPYPVERETSLQLIAEIAAESSDAKAVADAVEFLLKQEEAGRVAPGLAVRAVGRACASPAAPAEAVRASYRDYVSRVGKVSHSFDLLSALGWIGASPACDPTSSKDIALRLLELLESPMPDLDMTESKTDEGTHLMLGGSTRVYTDLVPDLIAGIQRIVLAGRLEAGFADDVVDRLCAKYRDLVSYKDVWAPGNVVTLAEAMGGIASAASTPAPRRGRIIETLLQNVRNITMVRILGHVCCRPDDEAPEFAEQAGRFASRCFQMLERPEYAEVDDQWALIQALGRTAQSRLGADAEETKRRVVDLLLERRDKFMGARLLLKELAASPSLPEAIRAQLVPFAGKS